MRPSSPPLEAILKGLNRTRFVGRYTKNAVIEHGLFDAGNSEKTLGRIREFIFAAFVFSQDRLPDEWRRRPDEGALLTINAGVTAYIWLLSDLLDFLVARAECDPLRDAPSSIVSKMSHLLDGFVEYVKNLSFEERSQLRTKYGSGADTRLWRCLQKGVSEYRPEFQPSGMDDYWRNQSKQFNLETYEKLGEIEQLLRDETRELLEGAYGAQWLKKGVPGPLFEKLHTDAAKKNRDIENAADEKGPWDCMYIVNYREVMAYGSNWSTLFQKRFTIPGQEKMRKDDKTSWLVRLNTIRNQNAHDHSVSEEDYRFVAAVFDWLVADDPEAIEQLMKTAEETLPAASVE